MPVPPPARDDVEALIEAIEQPGDVGRVVLAVAVHRDQDRPPRQVERRRERGGLAAVAAQEGDADVLGVAVLDLRELRRRPVGRAVIDEDQLVAERERAEHLVELGVERDDVLDLVVDGDQDRQVEDRGRVEHGLRVRHGTDQPMRNWCR